MKTRLLPIALVAILNSTNLVCAQTPVAPNPEVEAIRHEMQQMQQDYEQRIRVLESRLEKIETAVATNCATNTVLLVSTNSATAAAERGMAFL